MEIIFWKIINSFPLPNNVSMQVWSKSIHLFRRYRTETIFWIFQSGTVILKIRSMSLNFDQLLPSSRQCIYASLVKIHPLVQKISHGNHILDISKWHCDLKNQVNVTKFWSTPPLLPTMYLCKFGQNLSTSSEDNARKPYFGHFKVTMWPWKLNQGHQVLIISFSLPINVSMQVWSNYIH